MIIDAHAHLGPWPQFEISDVTVGTMLHLMDRLHISRAICSHAAILGSNDLRFGWGESLAAYRESAGRILLYTVFNPHTEGSLRFVEKCLSDEGCVGIKIHPSGHRCYADDDRYDPVWKLAAERRVPLLTHSHDVSDYNPTQKFSFPGLFRKFAEKHPGVTLILGHAGGRYEGHRAAALLASQLPNVCVDISGDGFSPGVIEYLVGTVGSRKILFGTDVNWMDPATNLGRVLDADILSSQKAEILWENAERLFGLK